jgi:hypothetical protein
MHRTRTGKRIAVTARDIEIFKLLGRYRYLRSTFIHAFVGGRSETRFKERLGHLYHDGGYLNRPQQQWQFAHSRYAPVVYENTDAAREVLLASGLPDDGCGAASVRNATAWNQQFAHTLMTCEILASIELAARSDPNLRFISWPEILAKAPENTRNSPHPFRIPVPLSQPSREPQRGQGGTYLVPDGLFGLEYTAGGKKSYRFFALEADRETMPVLRSSSSQTSYLRKLLLYGELADRQLYKSHLGLPNLLVLTMTPGEKHKDNMMSAFRKIYGGSTGFLFKTTTGLRAFDKAHAPTSTILTEPWERIGYPPLCIASPN